VCKARLLLLLLLLLLFSPEASLTIPADCNMLKISPGIQRCDGTGFSRAPLILPGCAQGTRTRWW
jgi:hypothetical protein